AIFGQLYSALSSLPRLCPFAKRTGIISFTRKTPLILLTKETIASNRPIGTAIVKFTNTVSKNVVTKTSESEVRSLRIEPNDLYSLILKATTIKIGAILANGTCEANGANNKSVSNTNTLWNIPENGLIAPLFIFVAVLAIAPVAGIPPKKGVTILAKPCPNNSRLDL